ncbi:hypothetical protein [Hahella sp. NBU794]|uniref:hypothetical protein n=1 Tax=Hahella sp. NBU794 TaxID=3422590 RepID=UPI003D6FFD5D
MELGAAVSSIQKALNVGGGSIDYAAGDWLMPVYCNHVFGTALFDFDIESGNDDAERVANLFLYRIKKDHRCSIKEVWVGEECKLEFTIDDKEFSLTVIDQSKFSDLRAYITEVIEGNTSYIVRELNGFGSGESQYVVIPSCIEAEFDVFKEKAPPLELLMNVLEVGSEEGMWSVFRACGNPENLFNQATENGDRPIFAAIRSKNKSLVKATLENASPFTTNKDNINAIDYAKNYFSNEDVIELFEGIEEDWYRF